LTGEVRQFSLRPPAIRIWSSGVVSRLILFDYARNLYHPDYLNWDPVLDAERSESESHIKRNHMAGFTLHAIYSFVIFEPHRAPRSCQYPPVDGFTELDLTAMDIAAKSGLTVEFYPHGNMGSAADDRYTVVYDITDSGRADNMWMHKLTIDFQGCKKPTAIRPQEL